MKNEVKRAFDELRVAADVCELDENPTVVRQATRIRAAQATLALAIEAAAAGETAQTGSTEGESAGRAATTPERNPR